ncbi:hypothetical protein SDRG_17037 [Saprolegnia diclina VS20]|uniref:Uncharacterized protein n=1 Tax=Saprolegnia diclina (strain VS20) TaxID=1156394 RepID=T0PI86_SAPDV|nr:hypothetical protein SDRG_17037 [Saprolegnia diclina VS20]EQC25079.1 hypothetical protein SDRG_17037 [Saprolegnia diclina VS20]|eukprot:XP_008621492.1 hypothetical protein SDRG_17037 [Saprolegnia diclina VS20]
MPIDTILPTPAHTSNVNNTPAMFNYGDQDALLPDIDSYMNDFTFDVDTDVVDVNALAMFLVGLEYLKSIFLSSANTA